MTLHDFSAQADPEIYRFGRGGDVVEVDLSFIPAGSFISLGRYLDSSEEERKTRPERVLATIISMLSTGRANPHEISIDWVLSNVDGEDLRQIAYEFLRKYKESVKLPIKN